MTSGLNSATSSSLHGISQDLRYALRALRRSPGFTFTAIATLAIGIGVNVTVFTITNAVLFKGFRAIDGNDRILYIDTREHGQGCCVSYPDFEDWRAQAKSFEGMGAVADLRITFNDESGSPAIFGATLVTANTFDALRQAPVLGRDFEAFDEIPGAPPVAILNHAFWERQYGKDSSIVGRTLRINGIPTTVIGVMAEGFSFPQRQDLWMPLTPTPDIQKREARGLWFAFGRLADGVTIDSARAEMETIGRQLSSAYPRTNRDLLPAVHSFHEFFIGPNAITIYGSMLGAVGLVLLIACANLANLLLARAIGRSREMSVRIALGAGRWRIIRQLLIESLALSAIGGAFGWWTAKLGLRVYDWTANPPSWFSGILDYTMDYRVVAYVFAISIGAALLFGLAPAARLSRLDVNARLKDGGRGATGGGGVKQLSSLLVTAEMALAIILLAGAGVMIRSFLNIYTADLGVRTDNIVTALLKLPETKYPSPEARIAFFEGLQARLQATPGVESIALVDSLPTWGAKLLPYELAHSSPVDEQRRPRLSALAVSPGYFRTMGTAVLSGRDFHDADGVSGEPAVLVNEQFASRYWPAQDPLGHRLRLFDGAAPGEWLTVVGVVPNIVQNDTTRQRIEPLVYLPYRQMAADGMWILAHAHTATGDIGAALRREVRALDPDLPIWLGPFTLADRLAGNYQSSRANGVLFLIFALVALLLASVGLYAVIAQSVSQQTQEIGTRIAIGATGRDILELVLLQGVRPLAIGLALGLAGSFAVNRILMSELVEVSPSDPVTLGVASAVLIVSAALGCWIPARRAMRVDPVIALRHE